MTSVPHTTPANTTTSDKVGGDSRAHVADTQMQHSVLGERGGIMFLLGVPAFICICIIAIAYIGSM